MPSQEYRDSVERMLQPRNNSNIAVDDVVNTTISNDFGMNPRYNEYLESFQRFYESTSNSYSLSSSDLETLRSIVDDATSEGYKFITLAGGAPRDLYFNQVNALHAKSIEDFDMYFSTLGSIGVSHLEHLGFTDVRVLSSEEYENEDEGFDPDWVAEGYYNGLKINFIVFTNTTRTINKDELINSFACSLSKFELDLERNRIVAFKEARLSMASKTLIFKPNTKASYLSKIRRYFPTYVVGSYQEAAIKLIDKEVNRLPQYHSTG